MKRALAIASLGFVCVLPQPGFAQQKNLEKAVGVLEQQAKRGRGEFISYLSGAATAYRWISSESDGMGARQAYCPPPNRLLDGRAYARIAIDEYRRAKPEYVKVPDYPLQVLTLALVRGLAAQFPCTSPEAEAIPAAPAPSAAAAEQKME
jgi:hypothetical protein